MRGFGQKVQSQRCWYAKDYSWKIYGLQDGQFKDCDKSS